jgi:heat shock protein HslJ
VKGAGVAIALVLAAVTLAGCGSSGQPEHERDEAKYERNEAKLEERARQRGFDRSQAETFATVSEVCGGQPKSEFEDVSVERLPDGASNAAIAHAYAAEWPRRLRRAVFEGCMDGLARVPARPPPSSPLARALWGRNFIATSVYGLPEKPDPPVDQPPHIRLSLSSGREHDLGWEALCNGYGGSVRITATKIEVDRVGSTLVGCSDEREAEDEWLSRFMESDPEWRLEATKLTLISNDAKIELKVLRQSE